MLMFILFYSRKHYPKNYCFIGQFFNYKLQMINNYFENSTSLIYTIEKWPLKSTSKLFSYGPAFSYFPLLWPNYSGKFDTLLFYNLRIKYLNSWIYLIFISSIKITLFIDDQDLTCWIFWSLLFLIKVINYCRFVTFCCVPLTSGCVLRTGWYCSPRSAGWYSIE